MKRARWLLPLFAYWSVWADYGLRVAENADAILHPLAALAGMCVLWRARSDTSQRREGWTGALALIAALAFALLFARLTAMPRCALALLGTGAFVSWQRDSARPVLGLCLLLLGVPAVAQSELVLGVPLRLFVAEAAAALIRASGLFVECAGTQLVWAGGVVAVDAPCAGLRMLWTGSFVALLALARFPLRTSDALGLAFTTPIVILCANVLRCAALFYVESGILPAPSGAHAAIGLLVFAGVASALWEGARFIHRRSACPAS
jgi:exosortase/archaeosortase family protein